MITACMSSSLARGMGLRWDPRFPGSAPEAAVLAVMDVAEDELTAMRGGLVT
jgi:hypothetical protein